MEENDNSQKHILKYCIVETYYTSDVRLMYRIQFVVNVRNCSLRHTLCWNPFEIDVLFFGIYKSTCVVWGVQIPKSVDKALKDGLHFCVGIAESDKSTIPFEWFNFARALNQLISSCATLNFHTVSLNFVNFSGAIN